MLPVKIIERKVVTEPTGVQYLFCVALTNVGLSVRAIALAISAAMQKHGQ
jgi:hypothetical protein